MHSQLSGGFSTSISFDEILTLNKILSKYDFKIYRVECVRSAFKIATDKGIFCMKKLSRGYTRALKSHFIIQHLNKNGFHNALSFYPNKDGEIFIRIKKSTYYLTYWIDAREASFNVLNDILKCAEFMSVFHNASKGIEATDKIKIRSKYRKTPRILQSRIDDMDKIQTMIARKEERSLFDVLYLENVENYIEEAEKIVSIMGHLDIETYLQSAEDEKYICHDSFYYQNILIDKNYDMYIIDLESCCFDVPANDLGKFIRRLISKGKYAWDFDLCRRIIEHYEKNRKMSAEELSLLYLVIMFPHKFWKLGRKKYIKTKDWKEERFEKKLKKLLESSIYKNEFAECFRSFYGIDEYLDRIEEDREMH